MSKILAIDDKPDNLVTLSALLKNLMPGCVVITAQSGMEGIEKARSELPDTILLDVRMPDVDGFETCRRLKSDESTKHIPVVMITAVKTDPQSRIKGLEIGADAFLAKPIDQQELVSQVKVALRIKKAEDVLREERDSLERLVKERTAALKEREEYFRSLVELTSDWIWKVDAEARYFYASPQVEDFLGYKTNEVLGKTPFDFMPQQEAERVKGIFRKISDARRPFKGLENLNIKKNGESVVLETSGIPIFDAAGKFGGYQGVDRDITERKKAEEALLKSEKNLRESQRIASVGNWHLDVETNEVVWSDELYKMYGFDPALPPPPYTEHMKLFVPESWERLSPALAQTINKGIPYELELETVRKDGGRGWMWVRGEAEFDSKGKTVGIWGAVQDITNRKQNEERYKKTIESSIDGFWLVDTNGRFLDVNDAYCNLSGYSRDELLNMSIMDVEALESREETAQRMQGIIKRKSERFESKHRHKNGKNFDVEVSTSYFQEDMGGIFFAFIRDITERKLAEKALIESEQRFKLLFDKAPLSYQSLDRNGNFIDVNETWLEILGYKKEEVIGRNFSEFLHPDWQEHFKTNFLRFKTVGEVLGVEFEIAKKNGAFILVSFHGKIAHESNGKFKHTHCVFRDITEQKRYEAERTVLEARLLQSQKMESIGKLAGGIAHDFNNILASVIGYTELSLDEVEKGTSIEDNLQEIYTAGKRAKDLVRQILAFARQSDEKLKPIQVDTIATESLKFIRSSIPTTIEIRQNIESDSLIMGNATQVHQILMNLFTNAAYAMEDKGGILEFSLKDVVMDCGVNREKLGFKPGNYIEIKVSDTGAGIAPEIIDSIFDPYFTTKGPGEGTGMGLATVHGIIESYGGKISIDSKPGRGSLFTIYLPVTRKRQESLPYQSEILPTGKERILFVDDEGAIAKMGSQVLERLGYSVTMTTSSAEALELFRARPDDFSLVITDMTMPDMTGDRLAVELMKIKPDIPVVLCTGYNKKISDGKASEIGIKAVVDKPVMKVGLAKTVRKVIDEAKKKT